MSFKIVIVLVGAATLRPSNGDSDAKYDHNAWDILNNQIELEIERPSSRDEDNFRQQYSDYSKKHHSVDGVDSLQQPSWSSWSSGYTKQRKPAKPAYNAYPSSKLALPALPPYPSYPPPRPLWALHRPTRKYEPYFGPKRTTPSTTATTSTQTTALTSTTTVRTTSTTPTVKPPCHSLPSYCDHISPHLPLPLECIDICDVDFEELSSWCNPATGNLPLDCIEIIQAFRVLQRERQREKLLEEQRKQSDASNYSYQHNDDFQTPQLVK